VDLPVGNTEQFCGPWPRVCCADPGAAAARCEGEATADDAESLALSTPESGRPTNSTSTSFPHPVTPPPASRDTSVTTCINAQAICALPFRTLVCQAINALEYVTGNSSLGHGLRPPKFGRRNCKSVLPRNQGRRSATQLPASTPQRGRKIDLDLEQESEFKSASAARSELLCASSSAALFGSSRSLSCSSSCSESSWDSQCNRLVCDHRNAAHVNIPGLVQSPAHSLPPFGPTHSCTSCAAGAPHLLPYCRIGQVADRGVP